MKKNGSQVKKNVMCIFYPGWEIEWRIFFNLEGCGLGTECCDLKIELSGKINLLNIILIILYYGCARVELLIITEQY